MPRIPTADLERLKSEVAVQRLVEGAGIELKRAGKDWLGRCPFHEDGEPSLVISPNKNLWHCFGCSAAGGPIDWVMKLRGVSFRHAVELLRNDPAMATDAGERVKQSSVKVLPAPVEREADDQAALNQVIDYYHATLKTSPEALAYLDKRGLGHPELIDRFRLGYANRTLGLRVLDKNRRAGHELRSQLQRVGIYRESGHEHFNGSLVVPVMSLQGDVVEVYGRKVLDTLRPGTPKHLYLPGPHAGVWNEASLASNREVILCEALLDAMTFWCAGYRNVTASYGVEGFTAHHLASFKRHGIERVLIAYDRDEAGDRAADALATRLRSEGFGVYRIAFPKGMDANATALKLQPASKSLGLLIRRAEWLGHGTAPERDEAVLVDRPVQAMMETIAPKTIEPKTIELKVIKPVVEIAPGHPSLAAQEVAAKGAVEKSAEQPVKNMATVAVIEAAVVPTGPRADVVAEVSEQEVVICFNQGNAGGGRRWRVRGLPKNLAVGVLKVNVMVACSEVGREIASAGAFHVDTFDLYAARARTVFVQQAAAELRVPEAELKAELGRVLFKLEQVQDEAIQKALQPQLLGPLMSDEDSEAALQLLRAPDLMARVLADFECCGIVGEATNKLTAYLAATSRKLARPLAVVVQSSSAAGKSSLMDAVLAFMPAEETVRYSAMSGQSLFYMGETNLKHKVLAIAEEEGASRASYALKLLQSDGELTMASTGTDANGNLVAQEYRVEGPMSLFMTTTAIDMDEELLNRCLVLSVDEGREQTAAIHRRQRERRTLDGLLGRQKKDAVLLLHQNAQRLLRTLVVVNPYADQLTFLDDRTRTRRDHEKYLSLIDTITLLHQYQRPVKRLSLAAREVEYIEVTLDDIARANALAHEVLGRSLDELPAQTRKLLVLMRERVEVRCKASGLARSEVRFSRKEVRDATGWGDTQLKVHLARLVEFEYLLAHRVTQGPGYVYELLYDGDGGDLPHLAGLIDPASLYDTVRSGVSDAQSAPGRPLVGVQTGPGRSDPLAAQPAWARLDAHEPEQLPEPRAPINGHGASYLPGVVPLTARG